MHRIAQFMAIACSKCFDDLRSLVLSLDCMRLLKWWRVWDKSAARRAPHHHCVAQIGICPLLYPNYGDKAHELAEQHAHVDVGLVREKGAML